MYSLPGVYLATTGETATAAQHNTPLEDIEADMNTARPVVAGGTGATTAAGARSGLGVRNLKAIDTTGSSNAYAVTSTDSLTPSDGDAVIVIANHANTGAATLNVDATGAVAIKKMVAGTATALSANDIYAGHHYLLTYDSGETAWLIAGQVSAAANVSITDSGAYYTGTEAETALQEVGASLALKAPLASPALTGSPTAPTQSAGDNSTKIATTAYVDALSTGFTLLTAQATTSGTSFDFTIPSGAKVICVMLGDISLSGGDDILVQLGDSGGVETTGYISSSTRDGGGASSGQGFVVQVSDGAGVVSGMMTISLLDSSANTWASMHGAKKAGQVNSVSGGGTKSLSAELTTVRIAADGANTFDAGSVNVSYSK